MVTKHSHNMIVCYGELAPRVYVSEYNIVQILVHSKAHALRLATSHSMIGEKTRKKSVFWNQELKCVCFGFLDTSVIA